MGGDRFRRALKAVADGVLKRRAARRVAAREQLVADPTKSAKRKTAQNALKGERKKRRVDEMLNRKTGRPLKHAT